MAITYDLLAWQKRQNTDDRTIGDIFYLINDSLPEIKFIDALVYLISELKQVKFELSDQIDKLVNKFIEQLPVLIQNLLKPVV